MAPQRLGFGGCLDAVESLCHWAAKSGDVFELLELGFVERL
jgi:hypothetical protein